MKKTQLTRLSQKKNQSCTQSRLDRRKKESLFQESDSYILPEWINRMDRMDIESTGLSTKLTLGTEGTEMDTESQSGSEVSDVTDVAEITDVFKTTDGKQRRKSSKEKKRSKTKQKRRASEKKESEAERRYRKFSVFKPKSEEQLGELFEKNWIAWCKTDAVEVDSYEITEAHGSVPADLAGIWYRNGPGKFKVGEQEVTPLDGDGFVVQVEFRDGKVFHRSKFIQTEAYKKECRTGKLERRGAFGTPAAKDSLNVVEKLFGAGVGIPNFKNTANTSLVYLDKSLVALWEGGLPHELDPITLETLETESCLDGVLKSTDMFGAHPKIDPKTGHLFNIGVNMIEKFKRHLMADYLNIWEVTTTGSMSKNKAGASSTGPTQPPKNSLKYETVQKLLMKLERPFSIIHEVGLTENYVVIPQSPVGLNLSSVVMGSAVTEAWFEQDDDLFMYVIPKKQPENVPTAETGRARASSFFLPKMTTSGASQKKERRAQYCVFRCPRSYTFHLLNTFERLDADGDTEIVVDVVAYQRLPDLSIDVNVGYGKYDPNVEVNEEYLKELRKSLGKVVRYIVPLGKRVKKHGWDGAKHASAPEFYGATEFLMGKDFLNEEATEDGSATLEERVRDFCFTGVDFPLLNDEYQGIDYNYGYFVDMTHVNFGDKHTSFASILKLNTKTKEVYKWSAPVDTKTGSKLILTEPCFVPKKPANGTTDLAEDDGYLLFSAFHGADNPMSTFFVVDAKRMETVSQFPLSTPVPLGVHTTYVPLEDLTSNAGNAAEVLES